MDVSAIIVVVVLTVLSLAAIVGLEIYSRKTGAEEEAEDQIDKAIKRKGRSRLISKYGVKRGFKT